MPAPLNYLTVVNSIQSSELLHDLVNKSGLIESFVKSRLGFKWDLELGNGLNRFFIVPDKRCCTCNSTQCDCVYCKWEPTEPPKK